jgi:hypothetical protein
MVTASEPVVSYVANNMVTDQSGIRTSKLSVTSLTCQPLYQVPGLDKNVNSVVLLIDHWKFNSHRAIANNPG